MPPFFIDFIAFSGAEDQIFIFRTEEEVFWFSLQEDHTNNDQLSDVCFYNNTERNST